MNFQCSEFFNFNTESPLCDFQENETFLSECPMIDRYGYDNSLLSDDKVASLHLKSTSPPPLIRPNEPAYPERSTLLGFRKRKLSDIPKSEPLVTKTNHFIYKDDFLWSDSKELPDVILVSPRRENTPDPNINTLFNFDDEKANLNFDFDTALKNVQVENGTENYSVDLVTKEDVEYLDSLLAGFSDQPVRNFDQDIFSVKSRSEVVASDLSSFNEISCNIHQQDEVTDSKSAIKTLLKHDSFKGNFHKKKSTEILSEIDQSHDCFAEHNYFSPTKVSKPRLTKINTEVADNASKCVVPCALSPSHVPIPVEDFIVETEISSTASSSLNLKTPTIVLSQCATQASSPSSTSVKPVKCKNRDVAKKVNKKPVLCKTDPDPTYEPNSKRRRSAKKSASAKNKTPSQSKLVASVTKFNTCSIAQLPRIPIKPASGAEPRSVERVNVVKSRTAAIEVPKVAPRVPVTSNLASTVAKIESDPVSFAGPSTPLASPTRDDVLDHDFSTEDSCQPETVNSNVDAIVEPIQPIEETPKVEKKKLSLQQYLQKRATQTKTDPDNESGTFQDPDPIESITIAPPPNVEEILRTIVKPEPLQIDDVLKTIAKSTPNSVVKTEPAYVAPTKPVIKSEPVPVSNTSIPVVKSQLIQKSDQISKNSEPRKESIRQRDEAYAKKPMAKPRRNPTTVSKPLKESVNNAPLKLIKLAMPEKAPSVRSYSLSPNEISQSNDSCDRYSSSGVSSYHNSSVSSTCGSPFTVHDDKSNDTKYSDSERIATSKQQQTERKMPQIPFAVNKELLRKEDRSSKKSKYRRDNRCRGDSISRKRKFSDSCFEDDSDCSDYSDRKRSRKRYSSTSSSSSDKTYHHRSHNTECSIPSPNCRQYYDWKYPNLEMVADPYCYNYNELPIFYPPQPAAQWHPEFSSFYPPLGSNMEVPYYYGGCHELTMDIGGDVAIEWRALFVGNIGNGVTENDLRKRFERFGDIQSIRIFRRESSSNYGFVYYTDEKYVQRAIQHGNDNPTLPHYKLSVGMRKERFTDRRAFTYDKATPVTNFQTPCYQDREREDTYSLKLEQLKNDLKQKKLGSRYK